MEGKRQLLEIVFDICAGNTNGLTVLSVIFVLLLVVIIMTAGCLFVYMFFPYQLMVISAVGQTVAIESRYYHKGELDMITIRKE